MDLGLVAFVFKLVVLCDCVIRCAYTVDTPAHHFPPQDDVHWRRMSDVAAAAAAAAVNEAKSNPSNETVLVIQIAARAATAATATALCGDPLELFTRPCGLPTARGTAQDRSATAASGCARRVGAEQERGAAEHGRGGGLVHARGGVEAQGPGGRVEFGRGGSVERSRGGAGRCRVVERPRSGGRRKPRTAVPLGDTLALIDIKDAGDTWAQMHSVFRLKMSLSAARDIYEKRGEYKCRAAETEDLSLPRLSRSYFQQVCQGLWDWYKTLQRVGTRHLPVSGSLLEARARRIAVEHGATGFKGSPHFIQSWARRHNLCNMALCEQGGSVDTEAAAARIIADPRILSWWTETDLRTDSLHQSDAPLGLTWCS